jgi:hypothetical protein
MGVVEVLVLGSLMFIPVLNVIIGYAFFGITGLLVGVMITAAQCLLAYGADA